MHRNRFEAVLVVSRLICAVCVTIAARARSPQSSPSAQAEPGKQSNQEINDGFVQKISKQIAGREQEPVVKVFKNIHIMTNTPVLRRQDFFSS
jgi:hypothetical protein